MELLIITSQIQIKWKSLSCIGGNFLFSLYLSGSLAGRPSSMPVVWVGRITASACAKINWNTSSYRPRLRNALIWSYGKGSTYWKGTLVRKHELFAAFSELIENQWTICKKKDLGLQGCNFCVYSNKVAPPGRLIVADRRFRCVLRTKRCDEPPTAFTRHSTIKPLWISLVSGLGRKIPIWLQVVSMELGHPLQDNEGPK